MPSSGGFAVAAVGALATLAVFAAACVVPTDEDVAEQSQAASVCAAGTVVQGVDVSVFQGTVDWTQVKGAGIDFAIARISDGSDLDTQFATNWSGMKTAGLIRGAYQYFEPGQDPTTQANIVIAAVGVLGAGDLPVTADMEISGGESAATIVANLQTWSAAVTAGTGKTPMVYTAEGYWDSSVGGSAAFGAEPLWVANWNVTCPTLPTGWSAWDFWQWSDMGTVAGVTGMVDLDEYNGTLAELQTFAGGASSSAPYYAAQYVSQSWPLATTTMSMSTCQTIPATLTLKNIGTATWDSSTRIGTTQPRDRTSVFADATWVSTNRAAQVTGTVAPGETYEFKFDFHAPPAAGSYDEFFGVVQDGVAWFSDPGQGGPPDDDLEAKIDVVAGETDCLVDPGVDAGTTVDGGPVAMDAGNAGTDGGAPDTGVPAADAAPPASGDAPSKSSAGCGCTAAGADGSAWASCGLALAFAAAVAARRRPAAQRSACRSRGARRTA